jgi:hypothetical protein
LNDGQISKNFLANAEPVEAAGVCGGD